MAETAYLKTYETHALKATRGALAETAYLKTYETHALKATRGALAETGAPLASSLRLSLRPHTLVA